MTLTIKRKRVSAPKQVKPKKSHNRTSRRQLKRFTRNKFGTFTYLLFILAAGLFTVLPLIYSVATSLKPLDELLIFPPRFLVHRPTAENYLILGELLSTLRVPFERYFFNSLFVSIVPSVLHVIIASMAAFVFSKTNWAPRKIVFMIVQLSLLFNGYTLSLPRYIIYSTLNMIDTYWVYILPMIPSAMGVFLMKQYMEGSIPVAILEAAKIDGATVWQIFSRIVLPIVKPCWLTLFLFSFRDCWNLAPAGTIFTEQLKTLPTIMAQITAGGIARSGSAMAVTVILMIPPIFVYMISQSGVRESMSSAGIKE